MSAKQGSDKYAAQGGANLSALHMAQPYAATIEAGADVDAVYSRLLEELSRLYPGLLPTSAIWGFGRPLWDPACRVQGQRPLRCTPSLTCTPAARTSLTRHGMLASDKRAWQTVSGVAPYSGLLGAPSYHAMLYSADIHLCDEAAHINAPHNCLSGQVTNIPTVVMLKCGPPKSINNRSYKCEFQTNAITTMF